MDAALVCDISIDARVRSRSGRRRRCCGHRRRRRFWRGFATIFSFRDSERSLRPPFARCRAETAAFVCICKRVYLGIVGHCADLGTILQRWVYGETTSGPVNACSRTRMSRECTALSKTQRDGY